jgi:hypothetical protein
MSMAIFVLLTILVFAGCSSPEVKRARGSGAGADLGYRGDVVEMHAGADPYYRTPQLIDSEYARSGDSNTSQRASRR